MFKVMEQALGDVVHPCLVPTVPKAEIDCLVYANAVTDSIVKSVLSYTEFLVTNAESLGEIVDRAADE